MNDENPMNACPICSAADSALPLGLKKETLAAA